MHELSLATDLIDQVQTIAQQEGAVSVSRIEVVIGRYSGVEIDAFQFAFPLAAKGSMAANAELTIIEQPITVYCRDCHAESHPAPTMLICQNCNSSRVELTHGRDILIQQLELEIPD